MTKKDETYYGNAILDLQLFRFNQITQEGQIPKSMGLIQLIEPC